MFKMIYRWISLFGRGEWGNYKGKSTGEEVCGSLLRESEILAVCLIDI